MTARPIREAHAHIAMHGRCMAMCDLSTCATRDDMIRRLADHRPEPSGWTLAHGARPEAWSDPRWPTRAELDAAVRNRPVAAWGFDAHSIVANSAALERAGISARTRCPDGVIELDPDGEPTGLLLEHAALRLWNAVPDPTPEQRLAQVRAALGQLAGLGYAEIHDLRAQTWLPGVLDTLARAGELPCRVVLWPLVDDVAAVRAELASCGHLIRLGGAKIFVDGTLNSRTAWTLEPCADPLPDAPLGTALLTTPQIADVVARLADLGLPLAAHAIGDGAVRAVLDAIELTGGPDAGPGHRIEHLELVHPLDVPRFARLGVIASVQPCHLLADADVLRRLYADRLERVLPLRSLIDAGCAPGTGMLFGSDVPIVRADPGDSIQAAVHRRRSGTPMSDAIAPESAISETEAWSCFECEST